MTRISGRASPTRSTAISPSRPGLASFKRQGLSREAIPFVACPRRQEHFARLVRGGRKSEQVGQAVEVEVDGLRRSPVDGVDRPGLEGRLGRFRGGPLGGVAPGQRLARSQHAATRSVRPSESKSVARMPETCWTDRRHLHGNFVKPAEAVVEHGDRRCLVGGQDQVEVAVVVDVEQGDARVSFGPAGERRQPRAMA